MAKKYYCPVCGYESDEPIDVCPVCGAKMAVREEGETSWAAEHKVGIIDGVSEEIVNGLRENLHRGWYVSCNGKSSSQRGLS